MANKEYKYMRISTLDEVQAFLNHIQPEGFHITTIDSSRKVFGMFQAAYAVFYWNEKNPIAEDKTDIWSNGQNDSE